MCGVGDPPVGRFGAGVEVADVEGEDGVFDGGGAVELPAAVGDGLDDGSFDTADGLEAFCDRQRSHHFRGLQLFHLFPGISGPRH